MYDWMKLELERAQEKLPADEGLGQEISELMGVSEYHSMNSSTFFMGIEVIIQ